MTPAAIRPWLWFGAGVVAVVVLVGYWRGSGRSAGSMADAAALAEASRFDEAEAIVRDLLRHDPDDPGANLLAAQVAIGRSETTGRAADDGAMLAALANLDRVRGDDPKVLAVAKLCRGKVESHLGRLDDAESSWEEALRLDPTVPEAGWSLLQLYYLQLRADDARRLALRLHAIEPDPRDRVQLLFELFRQAVQVPAPGSLVEWFEPIVKKAPGCYRASLALGSAYIRRGDYPRGLEILRRVLDRRPDRPEAWDAWLFGLQESADFDGLVAEAGRMPATIADLPRLRKYRARIAQERGDFEAAARDYRAASRDDSTDLPLQYRLSRVLRRLGRDGEAARLQRQHDEAVAASSLARTVYESVNADRSFGATPRPELYREIADLCEALGRFEECRAWHRLILQAVPGDPASLAALARLDSPGP